MKKIFSLDKGMTQAISHFSRHQDAAVQRQGQKYNYIGQDRKSAEIKIKKFYNLTIWTLVGVTVALFIVTNLAQDSSTTQSTSLEQSKTNTLYSILGGDVTNAAKKN